MRTILTLNHPNGVSGTSTMSDGTKVYWTEGRSTMVEIVNPDGNAVSQLASEPHPALETLENDPGVVRMMTQAEVNEHDEMRRC